MNRLVFSNIPDLGWLGRQKRLWRVIGSPEVAPKRLIHITSDIQKNNFFIEQKNIKKNKDINMIFKKLKIKI